MTTKTRTQLSSYYKLDRPVETVANINTFYVTSSYDGYGQIWLLDLQEDGTAVETGVYMEDSYTNTGVYKYRASSRGQTFNNLDTADCEIPGYATPVYEGVERPTVSYTAEVMNPANYRTENGYSLYNEELEQYIPIDPVELRKDMVIREDFNLTEEEVEELADIEAYECVEGQGYYINLDNMYISSSDKERMTILAKLNNRALPTSFNLKEISENNIKLVDLYRYGNSLEVIMTAPDAMDYEEGEDMTDEDYKEQVRDYARCYTELMGCEEGQLEWTYNETSYGSTINFNLN